MSHPLDMTLSLTGWSVEPELLDDIAIELFHSELFGDALKIKLRFKAGEREVTIEGELKGDQGRRVYDALQKGIGSGL
jgi:hypothetical protein